MRRREFIAVVGSAIAYSQAARAQRAVPVIGFLNTASAEGFEGRLRAFRQALKEAGFIEGETVSIIYRWADNRLERLPELAADLVRQRVSMIVISGGTAVAAAVKALNTSIPIVFATPEDPVGLGLVASLARPGNNMTGINFFAGEILAKRMELLRELVPKAVRVGVFVNPSNAARAVAQVKEVQNAASAFGIELRIFETGNSRDIDEAFATMARERPDALFISADPIFVSRRFQLVNLASRQALPTSCSVRELVEVGGLMSYGASITDAFRQVGIYTGRILSGIKPADLPILQPTKFELVINAQTARMFGITIPPSMLARADEVIE